jgi:hypothetical protein
MIFSGNILFQRIDCAIEFFRFLLKEKSDFCRVRESNLNSGNLLSKKEITV